MTERYSDHLNRAIPRPRSKPWDTERLQSSGRDPRWVFGAGSTHGTRSRETKVGSSANRRARSRTPPIGKAPLYSFNHCYSGPDRCQVAPSDSRGLVAQMKYAHRPTRLGSEHSNCSAARRRPACVAE